MPSIKKQALKKSKGSKRHVRPSRRPAWIVFLVLALNALAIPTHLLGMSIQTENVERLSSECPMHQDSVGDSGKDDSCVCSGGLCSVGSTNIYVHVGPEQFESDLYDTDGNFSSTFAQHARGDTHSIYQSRAPPPISLS